MALVYAFLEDQGAASVESTRTFRAHEDAFTSLSEEQFVSFFRLSKAAATEVCDAVREDIQRVQRWRRSTLSVEQRVLMALRFYATGAFLGNIGNDEHFACSTHAVSEAIHDVSLAIIKRLAPKYMKFPTTDEEKLEVKRGFYEMAGFPGCVGAIDGTEVAIMQPSQGDPRFEDSNYYCHKGYYAINVLAVCDASRRILYMTARYPGCCHDSSILNMCELRQAATSGFFKNEEWLIGDSAYPLEPWLMTPVRSPTNPEETAYNTAHTKTRCCIEQCFGVLKMRFRCLQRYRTLHFAPDRSCNIITACCILHNLCLAYNMNAPTEGTESGESEDGEEEHAQQSFEEQEQHQASNRGLRTREQLIARCFR
ncbi:putative nuclease HARBI1 [Ornithodoros turicata]|uniref:putative nuclease HARBI1 n=1 Tax=Ornithodoros turicata TaxID=34597 RepID=UPI0031394B9B